jgi:hypothetical protein
MGQNPFPEAPGRDTVFLVCSQCHSIGKMAGADLTADDWQFVVYDMIARGAPVQDDSIDGRRCQCLRRVPRRPISEDARWSYMPAADRYTAYATHAHGKGGGRCTAASSDDRCVVAVSLTGRDGLAWG